MPEDTQDDLLLIRRVLARDADAAARLAQRLSCIHRMVGYLNRRAGRPLGVDEEPDVAQDVFTTLWPKLDHYDGRRPLNTWVFRFCYLGFLSSLRKRRRFRATEGSFDLASEDLPVSSLERYEDLYRVLSELKEAEQRAVIERHFSGKSFKEISEDWGQPIGTAKTHYYRGLSRLRTLLGARRPASEASRIEQDGEIDS